MKPIKNILAFLLTAVLLLSIVPASLAAGGDAVLMSLGHALTDNVTVGDPNTPITLTVSQSYSGATVDLSSSLSFTYDTNLYKNVIATPSGAATVGGPTVTLTVTYNNISDAAGTPVSSTSYTVLVVREVLTSIGNTNTNTVTLTGPTRTIALTVPQSYAQATVDLSNGLTITYNTAKFKNVVASPSAPAVVGDTTGITLHVTFNLVADASGAPKYAVDYFVQVTRAQTVDPTFSGTIAKEMQAPGTMILSLADFQSMYTQNDGDPFASILISGSNPTTGTLKLNNIAYDFNSPITMDALSKGKLTFTATAAGTVSYDVCAYESADASTRSIGNVVLTITAYTAPTINTAINETVAKGAVMSNTSTPSYFTAAYFTSHCDMVGQPPVSIEITPTNTAYGTWYLGTTSFNTAKLIAAADLGSLSFQATAVGAATFNWRISNKAGFSATGIGTINITSQGLTLISYTSPTTILKGNPWPVSLSDFQCPPNTASLAYIKITTPPAAADGYLELTVPIAKNDTYGYPAVAANTALAGNVIIPSAYLGNLRLVTKSSSSSNAVSFKWSATADLKISTASWADPVTYTVNFTSCTIPYTDSTYPAYPPVDMNTPLSFKDISSRFTTNSGGYPLSYMTFTLPDKSAGTLYLNYDQATKTGTAITATTKYYASQNPNIADISFVPATGYLGTVTITFNAYTINAYTSIGSFIPGSIVIKVSNSPGGTVTLQTDKNSALQFDAGTFQTTFRAATGRDLSYVVFNQLPSNGVLYYNYTPNGTYDSTVGYGIYYVKSSPYLSLVTFVPTKDYTGTVSLIFWGYDTGGTAYQGKLDIAVVDSPGGIVTYSLKENGYIALSGKDFSNQFVSVTGSILSYITFTPPASSGGTLYYQYDTSKQTGTKLTSAIKYYDGASPGISDITYVPPKDFVGTVVVAYKAYNAAGTLFNGKLKFIVTDSSSLINYSVVSGKTVSLNSGDFQTTFNSLSGGKTLSYVKFELPASSYGRLYYNYVSPSSYDSAVTADKQYFADTIPSISGITFVPADSYTGSFTFNFTGYSAAGTPYSGKVRITVSGSASGSVNYTTNSLTPVTLNAADFVSLNSSAGTLSYITFTLPYSSYGTLYYGYSSASYPGSAVSALTPYYVAAAPSISSVTFVPNAGFSGVLAIAYTAYGTSGSSPGTILITVKSGDVDTVTYTTQTNTPLQFNADDFNASFLNKTGSSLSYILFSLPPSSYGTLYLGYTSSSYAMPVTSATKYYRSYSPQISDVSFVPNKGFTGNVTIAYTGYTVGGMAYTGKIFITVGASVPFPDMKYGYDWAAGAVSYLYNNGVVTGSDDGNYYPANYVTRGDFILMVTRAFGLNSYTSDNFSDVPLGIYYYSAIATAKYYGIVSGDGDKFYPTAYISRQDAMVILYRTLAFEGIAIADGTDSDLAAFSDTDQISDYAYFAMASLVKAGVITGSGSELRPKAMITRAEMAVMLYKVLTM